MKERWGKLNSVENSPEMEIARACKIRLQRLKSPKGIQSLYSVDEVEWCRNAARKVRSEYRNPE